MPLHRLGCDYYTIPNDPNPRSAPRPGLKYGKVLLHFVSLGLSESSYGRKANKATALKPHCLIPAFCNAFDLKDYTAKGLPNATA